MEISYFVIAGYELICQRIKGNFRDEISFVVFPLFSGLVLAGLVYSIDAIIVSSVLYLARSDVSSNIDG